MVGLKFDIVIDGVKVFQDGELQRTAEATAVIHRLCLAEIARAEAARLGVPIGAGRC